jgi:ABC-type nitrate/sulfonate/bicarbonate transport system substrate-binding protein
LRQRIRPAALAGVAAALSFWSTAAAAPESVSADGSVPPIRVVMQLDWRFNAQFAGFYQAIEQGYFAEAGLEIELRGGVTTPDTVAATLAEPLISFGCAESNVILGDAAAGAPVRVLGTMFQDSPMGWMHLAGGAVSGFGDLVGAKVGIHADGNRVLKLLLEREGFDTTGFETFSASHDPQQLLDGTADALQCYYIDEFVRLRQLVGDQARVFLAKDFGYQAFSQVIFTHAETLEKHPEVVRAFLQALKQGWAYTFAHQTETVDLILRDYDPDIDRDYQIASLALIEELMVPEAGALMRPMDPAVWESGQAYLLQYNLIDQPISISTLLDQSHLPH